MQQKPLIRSRTVMNAPIFAVNMDELSNLVKILCKHCLKPTTQAT